MKRIEIREDLVCRLSKKRMEHTLGVEYTATALAMKYGEDIQLAALAGLLHDCAKFYSNEEKINKCEEYHIPIRSFEYQNPELLHAKLGAFLAKEEYGIQNEEILQAIACHTTGKPNMSKLDKILYVADFIEPNRKDIPMLDQIRMLAFEDLDQCFFQILKNSFEYLKTKDIIIDDMTEVTYHYYQNKFLEK